MREKKRTKYPGRTLLAAITWAVLSGASYADGEGHWRVAGGVSVPDATIPAGRVSDSVHTSHINDADARMGAYVEVARTWDLGGDFVSEVEGGLGYNSAKGTGRIRQRGGIGTQARMGP